MRKFLVLISLVLAVPFMVSCSRSKDVRRESRLGTGQTAGERDQAIERANEFAAPRKRTLVLPFWNDTPIKERFSTAAQAAVKSAYAESVQVNLVRDSGLDRESKDFYLDPERIDLANLAEYGRKWGVSLIVIGRISRIVFRKAQEEVGLLRPSDTRAAAYLEIRMIDVAAGKLAAKTETVGIGKSATLNVVGEDAEDSREERVELVKIAIQDAVKRALPVLDREVHRVTWRGRIAKISGGRFYINAGRATGINLGDVLKVTTAGTDVFDPETGNFIGRTDGEIKGTLEIVDFFGDDGAVGRIHSGGNFMENDVVHLY